VTCILGIHPLYHKISNQYTMNSMVKGYFNTDELQNLAETYNQVYKENKEAQKLIRHEAEYDSLKRAFRTIDYVCRIGGDEFAIIMVEMTSSRSFPQCGRGIYRQGESWPKHFQRCGQGPLPCKRKWQKWLRFLLTN